MEWYADVTLKLKTCCHWHRSLYFCSGDYTEIILNIRKLGRPIQSDKIINKIIQVMQDKCYKACCVFVCVCRLWTCSCPCVALHWSPPGKLWSLSHIHQWWTPMTPRLWPLIHGCVSPCAVFCAVPSAPYTTQTPSRLLVLFHKPPLLCCSYCSYFYLFINFFWGGVGAVTRALIRTWSQPALRAHLFWHCHFGFVIRTQSIRRGLL